MGVEPPVSGDAGVRDDPVQARADLQRPGPVLRRESALQGHQVRPRLAGETPLRQPGPAPLPVHHQGGAGQHTPAQIQLQGLLGRRTGEPVAAGRTERQRQPVRAVDQVLVGDGPARHGGGGTVVAAGQVGARVVHAVGDRLRSRAPGDQIPVADRAQRFPQPLLGGVEALVAEDPRVRHDRAAGRPRGFHRITSQPERSSPSLRTASRGCSPS